MATTIPALRGKMGNTTYYGVTMKVSDLVARARPANERDEWTTQSIEERMQRDPDIKRVRRDIAPYLAKSEDRFFGSIIVLLEHSEVTFEGMAEIAKLPKAYQSAAQDLGILTIDGGEHIVLDGQHRLLALRELVQGKLQASEDEEAWPFTREIANDEVSVIFIENEDKLKTRRIFNRVNRYAKTTSRADNIITSEDDGYAIIARRLLDEGEPLAPIMTLSGKPQDLVNWRSNTLSAKSTQFTTISVIYETVKLILAAEGVEKLNQSERPKDSDLSEYHERVRNYWWAVIRGINAYRKAMEDPSEIPNMRQREHSTSLLFKPAAQLALFRALTTAVERHLPLEEAVRRANRIDWSMTSETWLNVIMKPSGTINASADAVRFAGDLITYLIAPDLLSEEETTHLKESYNTERGRDPLQRNLWEPLPTPVLAAVAA